MKKTIKIQVEVIPSQRWKTTLNEHGKQERKSFSTKIAKAMIKEIEHLAISYVSEQMLDDEAQIVYDVCGEAGVDNYDDEHFGSLVAGIKIQGIDQMCHECNKMELK